MAVLVEAITVVVRCRAILQVYAGGQAHFVSDIPNASLRSDGELAAVTFMTPEDVRKYVCLLEERGLRYFDGTHAVDLAVVDQHSGIRAPCPWAVFGVTNWSDVESQTISVCQFNPSSSTSVVAPQGWRYEESLTAKGRYISADQIPHDLKQRRREPGRDVFWDGNRELYVYHL
jgi:hypothetical protein